MADDVIVEVFAGAGGMSEAVRMVYGDRQPLTEGIETDKDACRTAEAAGHGRICADVSMFDLRRWAAPIVGLLGGPPCQSYSSAGKQLGKLDRPRIEAHIQRIRRAGRWLHYSREGWHDPRSPLVLEVLRYALTLRPEWIVLEQVPQVLPLWELVAEVLRDHGWSVDTGVLKAEQYAVPQTRKRAFLAASRRVEARLPQPTHRAFRKGVPQAEGDSVLLPWMSMADALHVAAEFHVGFPRRPMSCCSRHGGDVVVLDGQEYRARDLRHSSEPAQSVTERTRSWVMRSSAMANATVRELSEPSPTITAGHDDRAERVWMARFGNQAHSAVRGVDEPAATVRYSQRMNACDWLPVDGSPVRVSVEEAAVFQSFRPDYPWQGSLSAQYRQVGDAAPPVLVAAVIRELIRA